MIRPLLDELTGGDERLAERAASGLASLPPDQLEQAFDALRALLDDPASDNRWWAVRSLSVMPIEGVSVLLTGMLADPDLEVRQCAALGLRLNPDPAAVSDLLQLLADPDPILARLAGEALAAIGSPAVPGLVDSLENGPQQARLIAVRALAQISDTSAVPALFAALDDESMLIEYWANQGLERMGIGMVFFQP